MLGEIDRDSYCSANDYSVGKCVVTDNHSECYHCLDNYHRKYPTPEQFKEEHGEEWKGAVYYHCTATYCDDECEAKGWLANDEYGCLCEPIIICACTPWGKPPDDWRPE
jgi:hypothetical protein